MQDPETRCELAIECGNIDIAINIAKKLDRPKLWSRFAVEALAYANHKTVEMIYIPEIEAL